MCLFTMALLDDFKLHMSQGKSFLFSCIALSCLIRESLPEVEKSHLSQAKLFNFSCTQVTCLSNDLLYSEENEHCMHENLSFTHDVDVRMTVSKQLHIAQQQDTRSGMLVF